MAKVVLVTGVTRDLGSRFARMILRVPGVERVIGVDAVEPRYELDGVEFVHADIRNPMIAKVVASAAVDTVVHLSPAETPPAGYPAGASAKTSAKETNVIGTMQLLAACQKAPSIRKLVVRSTTAVYGASPRDPAIFEEDMEPRVPPSSGWAKDALEVEGYVRGFVRRRPDVAVTVLRFAPILGPTISSPMADYFSLTLLPTVLGYDPRLQFVHEDDVLASLRVATDGAQPGTYNIAADGILLLSQAARRLGRPVVPVPSPAVGLVGQGLRRIGAVDLSAEQVRLLTHGRVVDTARARERLGFVPRRTTAETFEDFVRGRGLRGLIGPERIGQVPDRIASLLLARTAHEEEH
ncbi:NAD-dependent epimerase/dehydratase family protein [Yinghuangia seranimata]|uniref:NAD-dependent epimerase/dehydratase family protein n=1 Tax=Yinghuangia seranimata TaxID=408067 RepID=UPI00248D3126|nr:NAD-dependent epimerase/dehydratase family protein [Yinghuangia seranimata]MDI2132909.1 NAD-dependent epimerase/dehydratase family protein [Yinghuangia seranimata]